MFLVSLYIAALHVLGAFLFLNLVDGWGDSETKKALYRMPRYLRIFALLLWPIIMTAWLISGVIFKK